MKNLNQPFSRVFAGLCLAALMLIPSAWANNGPSEYQVKAAFLYQFTKYTLWPDKTTAESPKTITICLIGGNPFADALSLFDKASSAKLTIRVNKNVSTSGLSACQILFVAKGAEADLASIVSQTKSYPILTVSEIKGFAEHGGMIEIQTQEKTIGVFERNNVGIIINSKTAQKVGIGFDAQLLEIAKSVIR